MKSLGIDIGSSSVKVSLLDIASGECAASSANPATEMPIGSPQSGWAEQDPQYYWAKLGEACQQLRLGVDEVQPDQAPRVGEQLAQLGHGDVVSFLHAVAPGSALHHAHGDSIPPVRPDRSTSVCRRRKVRTYPAKALDEA